MRDYNNGHTFIEYDFVMTTENESLEKLSSLCSIFDPIMTIQASITILKQNLDVDDDTKQRFERIERSVNKIYEYIKEHEEYKIIN